MNGKAGPKYKCLIGKFLDDIFGTLFLGSSMSVSVDSKRVLHSRESEND